MADWGEVQKAQPYSLRPKDAKTSPMTRAHQNPCLQLWAWVLTGTVTGVGCMGKPQGSLWYSLIKFKTFHLIYSAPSRCCHSNIEIQVFTLFSNSQVASIYSFKSILTSQNQATSSNPPETQWFQNDSSDNPTLDRQQELAPDLREVSPEDIMGTLIWDPLQFSLHVT